MNTPLTFSHLRAPRFRRPVGFLQMAALVAASVLPACVLLDEGAGLEGEELSTTTSELGVTKLTVYADLNGDGRNDRIARTSLNEFVVSLATSATTYGTATLWATVGGTYVDNYQAQFVDLNGDNKKDLAFRASDNRFFISLSSGTSFSAPAVWASLGTGYNYDQPKYADLNNDRKMDLIFRKLDNTFWVALSTGTSFQAPTNWLTIGGTYAVGQASYSDLNTDGRADLTFKKSTTLNLVSYSTGTGFTAPIQRDPACGNAFGCLVVTSAALPGPRTINTTPLEPHYYQFPSPVVKDIGLIKAGERITLVGELRSQVLSSGGYGSYTDHSDYLRLRLPPGVTVSGTKQNEPRQHLCSSGWTDYYADIATDTFPWTTEGYVRTTFYTICQALGSDLIAPWTVYLTASKATIYITATGPGISYKVTGTRGAFGLPAGTYTIRAGTDADSDGVLCETGEFCGTSSVVINAQALKTLALTPR